MMHACMTLDEAATTPTFDHAAPPPMRACAAPAGRRLTASLVLFVGSNCRPQPADCEILARAGMRSVWLSGIDRALDAAHSARFDAVVLDASTLEGRGGNTLAHLRCAHRCGVVVLADHGDEIDEILALELGADAFLLRPVAPRRLRAHLAALMRPYAHPAGQPSEPIGSSSGPAVESALPPSRVDRVSNRLFHRDGAIALTEVQGSLLECLFEAQGSIVARERLLAALPPNRATHARNVDVYIHRLRKRLLDAGAIELSIEAVRGRGYVLRTPTESAP